MATTDNYHSIKLKLHSNPLLNKIISWILEIPELNKRSLAYHLAIVESDSKTPEVIQFLKLALAGLATHWELDDPAGVLPNLASQKKAVLLACNHPLGGRDGLALLECMSHTWEPQQIKAVVNEFLLTLPYLSQMFLPISPLSMKSTRRMGQMRQLNTVLEQDIDKQKALLFFPAGFCSRWHKASCSLPNELSQFSTTTPDSKIALLQTWQPLQQVYDLPWQHSFLRLARKYQLPILLLHISGRNSAAFYRLAQIRQQLGLRFNWELLLLPKEFLYNRKTLQLGRMKIAPEEKCQLTIRPGALLQAEQLAQWPVKHDPLWAQLCKHYVYQLPLWDDPATAEQNLTLLHQTIINL